MKYKALNPSPFVVMLLVLVSGAGLVACDNQVSFTGPTFPDYEPQINPVWTLSVSGSLVAEGASCVRATILFDGQEIQGARTRCGQDGGCAELELTASIAAQKGHHTITFQVLRQTAERDSYLAYGLMTADRDDIDLNFNNDVMVNLNPRRESLQQGEGITFEFDLQDFE